MKILFWNTHKNHDINDFLSTIIKDYEIDIVVLAEYEADEQELYQMIRNNQQYLTSYTTIGCERIKFLGNYIHVEPSVQNDYYSIQVINNRFIICGVHLPSDLHGDRSLERYKIAREIINDIHDAEQDVGGSFTIIAGDFNEMPYDNSCLNADAFHGLPVYRNGSRERTVTGYSYQKYYNPMWNFLGDFSSPPGTYYRNDSSLHDPMWYMLDQFIFGHDVVPMMNKDQLRIITNCGKGDLANKFGHPDKSISDHFPIMCEIIE